MVCVAESLIEATLLLLYNRYQLAEFKCIHVLWIEMCLFCCSYETTKQ